MASGDFNSLTTTEQAPRLLSGDKIWQKTAWARKKKAPNNMEVAYQQKQIGSEGVGPPWIGEEGRRLEEMVDHPPGSRKVPCLIWPIYSGKRSRVAS